MSLGSIQVVESYPRSYSLPQGMLLCLKMAFILLAGLGLIELVVSYQHHNLSLLADAGHVASDAGAISLTLLALWLGVSQQKRQTRWEAIVAFANSLSLLVIALNVIIAAISRLHSPTGLDNYNNTANVKRSGYQNVATRQILMLGDGQEFYLSGLISPKTTVDMFQVYTPLFPTPDLRE